MPVIPTHPPPSIAMCALDPHSMIGTPLVNVMTYLAGLRRLGHAPQPIFDRCTRQDGRHGRARRMQTKGPLSLGRMRSQSLRKLS